VTRAALLAAVVALALAAGTASAAPPITCGKYKGYVVKSHTASCAFAFRSIKAFMAHRTQPPLYKCKRYSADVPAYCLGTGKYKRRYFFASKPS
jgi:hypothetical protein